MWIAWLRRRLPGRDRPAGLAAAGGHLEGSGAVAGGEVIPVREAGHGADIPDDRGGDHRADPKQPGQAGPGRTAVAAVFLVSRIAVSMPRRSPVSSAASSRRAAATASAGVMDARICPA
jgi:hypothetical protein